MQNDGANSTVYLCYSGDDADFAYKLAADLKDSGFDIWIERFDLAGGEELPPILAHCRAAIPVISTVIPASAKSWADLTQRAPPEQFSVIPLVLSGDLLEGSINFATWRNDYLYHESLKALKIELEKLVSISEGLVPDPETSYTNHLVADINRYRSYLETISPKSDALPVDKRAIYARSMWGLTGAFEIQGGEYEATYQFYEILDQFPRFVLVGARGSGKTITMYRALLDTLRAHQANRKSASLPIILRLGQWIDDTPFERFLHDQWQQYGTLINQNAPENLVLFLDGLDELGGQIQHKSAQLAAWLNEPDIPHKVVITCQEDVYTGEIQLDLPIITLREIDVPRIRQYVVNHLEDPKADQLLKQIIHPGEDDEPDQAIRLARNAQFLAIMVSFAQKNQDLAVPTHEAPLLDWFAKHLWDSVQTEIDFNEALDVLSLLAFSIIEDELPVYVSFEYARQHITSELIFQAALDARLLTMRNDLVAFCNSAIRDYFAAYQLMTHEGVYTRLMRAQFDETDERINWKWDSVVVLCSGLVENPDGFVREIAEVNPYLALEIVASGVQIKETTRQDIIDRLMHFTKSIDETYLNKILKSLRTVVDANAIPALLEHLHSNLQSQTLSIQTQSKNEDSEMPFKSLGTDTVRHLLDILRGEKWERRRGAAWALGEIQESLAVPSLIEALKDENAEVRQEAINALLRIGRPALPRLFKALQDSESNTDLRAGVIKVLGKVKDASAVSHLSKALSYTQWPQYEEVRLCDLAAIALEQIGTDEALSALDAWQQDDSRPQNQWVERVQPAQTVPEHQSVGQLLEGLKNTNSEVRRDTFIKLGAIRDSAALPHIIQAAGNQQEDGQVRWAAVEALGNFRGAKIVQALLNALHDTDALVCDSAAKVLGQLGDKTAIPGLVEALSNNSADVRGGAAEALGLIGDESAVPYLTDALADNGKPRWEDKLVCDIAAEALERINTEQALYNLNKWRGERESLKAISAFDPEAPLLYLDTLGQESGARDSAHRSILLNFLDAIHYGDWHVREAAAKDLRNYARTLKGSSDEQAIDKLLSALLDEASIVRWTAAEALAWIGDSSATPALLRLLNDNSWTVRVAAVRALQEIEDADKAVIDGLINALNDPNHLVREAAAETLGLVGDDSALGSLRTSLADSDSFVRSAAVEALGKMGDDSVISDLIAALQDEDLKVRWIAAETLGKLGAVEALDALAVHLDDNTVPEWEDRRLCDMVAQVIETFKTDESQSVLGQWRAGNLNQEIDISTECS